MSVSLLEYEILTVLPLVPSDVYDPETIFALINLHKKMLLKEHREAFLARCQCEHLLPSISFTMK